MRQRIKKLIFEIAILYVLLFSSCRSTGRTLQFDEITGYNFVDFLNQGQEDLLKQMRQQQIEYEEEKIGDSQSIYHLQETIFGDATKKSTLLFAGEKSLPKADLYRRSLLFPMVENPTELILYRYEEIAGLDYWPTEADELGEKILSLYDELINRYGKPDCYSFSSENEGILEKPADRHIVWKKEDEDFQISIHVFGDRDSFYFDIAFSSILGEQLQREGEHGV